VKIPFPVPPERRLGLRSRPTTSPGPLQDEDRSRQIGADELALCKKLSIVSKETTRVGARLPRALPHPRAAVAE
jgi:hypothetical protein